MGISYGNYPCLDPEQLLEDAVKQRLPANWINRANSFTCPLGPAAGHGWLLMLRKHVNSLNVNQYYPLTFADGVHPPVVLRQVLFLRSVNALAGFAGDPQTPVLVEVTDRRKAMQATPWTKRYNCRTGQPPPKDWIPDSLYSGAAPWTWTELVQDLWNGVGKLGPWPGLPYNPDGIPENWSFIGSSAYDALNKLLGRLALALQYDPFADQFTLYELGSKPDTAYTQAAARYTTNRLWDDEAADGVRGNVPAAVQVFFPTIGLDQNAIQNLPQFAMVPVPNPQPQGTEPGSVAILWDDLSAQYATVSLMVTLTNLSGLQSRAQERATNYFNVLNDPNRRQHRIYTGFLRDFKPGYLSAVSWYDFGTAMKTEAIRFPGVPTNADVSGGGGGCGGSPSSLSGKPPCDADPSDPYAVYNCPDIGGSGAGPGSGAELTGNLPYLSRLQALPPFALHAGPFQQQLGWADNRLKWSVLSQQLLGDNGPLFQPEFDQFPWLFTGVGCGIPGNVAGGGSDGQLTLFTNLAVSGFTHRIGDMSLSPRAKNSYAECFWPSILDGPPNLGDVLTVINRLGVNPNVYEVGWKPAAGGGNLKVQDIQMPAHVVQPVSTLTFNNLIFTVTDNMNGEAQVNLKGTKNNAVLWCDSAGNPAQWSQAPLIQTSVTIGINGGGTGSLILVSSAGNGDTILQGGGVSGGDQTLQFPTSDPTNGQVLQVNNWDATNRVAQLAWGNAGGGSVTNGWAIGSSVDVPPNLWIQLPISAGKAGWGTGNNLTVPNGSPIGYYACRAHASWSAPSNPGADYTIVVSKLVPSAAPWDRGGPCSGQSLKSTDEQLIQLQPGDGVGVWARHNDAVNRKCGLISFVVEFVG